MISREITIINKLGLHARAAAKLVTKASQFESDIQLTRNTQKANAKSIMGVMMLAAGQGTNLQLTADGDDESTALEAVIELIQSRFGEPE